MAKTATEWLAVIQKGPDEVDCRGCNGSMFLTGDESTPLCHHCAQEALEVLASEYLKVHLLAKIGWRTVRALAMADLHATSEAAAAKALKALGDG